MKNKFLILSICLFINLFTSSNLKSLEIFNFNATEIEITQDGNIFKGYKGGEAFTDDGVFIKAESFEFNKTTTLLVANGNVQLIDEKKDIVINADQISYLKNQETIIAIGNVKLDDKKKDVLIKANKISYYKNDEKIIANDNVQLKDNIRNIILNTNEITYLKKERRFFTRGKTEAELNSKYKFYSQNVIFDEDEMKLSSQDKTTIEDDKFSRFELSSFSFLIEKEFLKGVDVSIIQNTKVAIGGSDRLYFKDGFFDLKNKNYLASST